MKTLSERAVIDAVITWRKLALEPVYSFASLDAWSDANHAAEDAVNQAVDALIEMRATEAPVPIFDPGSSRYDRPGEEGSGRAVVHPGGLARLAQACALKEIEMGITDTVDMTRPFCECRHPREWHSEDQSFCLVALDIDIECPCKGFAEVPQAPADAQQSEVTRCEKHGLFGRFVGLLHTCSICLYERQTAAERYDSGYNGRAKDCRDDLIAELRAEQDDWKAIEDWRAHTSHEVSLTSSCDANWCLMLINWGPKCEQRGGPFRGERVKVVAQGAAWCRDNDRANHAEQVSANLEMLERQTAASECQEDAASCDCSWRAQSANH